MAKIGTKLFGIVVMSIVIIPITDHEVYEVNGKEIYKDSNGNWIAREEFTRVRPPPPLPITKKR